jgi:hypothetical protein
MGCAARQIKLLGYICRQRRPAGSTHKIKNAHGSA